MKRYGKFPKINSSEITSESNYLNRRTLIKRAGAAIIPCQFLTKNPVSASSLDLSYSRAIDSGQGFYTSETKTPLEDVKKYCNFYEFGTGKTDPEKHSHSLTVDPWSLDVQGEVRSPGTLHLEDILSSFELEERIYRLRCVEAWSMVIPWIGFPLSKLLARFEPKSSAKYVEFRTLYRPSEMPGTRSLFGSIDWPYREGLRIDEAMHPLSLMAIGLYGKTLPNQNGAPIRLVVPWKYGFKSIKSIVSIRLVRSRPSTTWEKIAPDEYGFYANVNPEVSHPRWSQRTERRLPNSLFNPRRINTKLFNGYTEQVASLYTGMDLRKYF